jgi:hypothetical protein
LTLREIYRLKVSDNKDLRRIFSSKRYVIIVCWKKLHNKELHNFYSSLTIIRMIKSRRKRLAEHVACMKSGGECM